MGEGVGEGDGLGEGEGLAEGDGAGVCVTTAVGVRVTGELPLLLPQPANRTIKGRITAEAACLNLTTGFTPPPPPSNRLRTRCL